MSVSLIIEDVDCRRQVALLALTGWDDMESSSPIRKRPVETRAREDDICVKSQSRDPISRFIFYFPKFIFKQVLAPKRTALLRLLCIYTVGGGYAQRI